MTVSLKDPADIHYAVFPTTWEDESNRALEAERPPTGLPSTNEVHANLDTDEKSNEYRHRDRGCSNATFTGRGPIVLNDTLGIIASGVVPAATGDTISLVEKNTKSVPAANVAASATIAATTPGAEAQPKLPWRLSGGEVLEAAFRVEGLKAAKAYDVCIFTETPGSHGYGVCSAG